MQSLIYPAALTVKAWPRRGGLGRELCIMSSSSMQGNPSILPSYPDMFTLAEYSGCGRMTDGNVQGNFGLPDAKEGPAYRHPSPCTTILLSYLPIRSTRGSTLHFENSQVEVCRMAWRYWKELLRDGILLLNFLIRVKIRRPERWWGMLM